MTNAGRETPRLAWVICGMLIPYLAYAEFNGWFNEPLYLGSKAAFWIVDVLFHAVYPITCVLILHRRYGVTPALYGFDWPPRMAKELIPISILYAVVLGCAFFGSARVVWMITGHTPGAFWYGETLPQGFLRLPVNLYYSITAGFVESAVYIGLPWALVRHRLATARLRWWFVLASSIVFASVHWEQHLYGMAGAFVFGIVACILFFRIRDLWPVAIAHTLVDAYAFW